MPAAGAGMAALGLMSLVGIVRARRKRRRGEDTAVSEADERRGVAWRETERRMAAYLAAREDGRGSGQEPGPERKDAGNS